MQPKENDEHLREGDEPTLEQAVPGHERNAMSDFSDPDTSPGDGLVDKEHSEVIDAEQREKYDEDEEASHLLHHEDLPDPAIEP